ncbi:MAG TPA: YkgJ family cysteine cluster protein [Candidatus Hydrogenedens sp.]|nr:YkgJ family cysteine cluster protein [Candidatus Hydrogenedens sp.]
MGKKFVRFRCHHCGHCCTDVICCPTPYDICRIVQATHIPPKKFLSFIEPEEIQGVNKSDPTWLKIGNKKYLMTLKRTKKGCFFRDSKKGICKIYEHRPLLCRLFPFKLRQTRTGKVHSFSLHKDVGCPKHRDGIVYTDYLAKIWEEEQKHQEDYQDLVAFFNNPNKKGKKPFDFVDLFVVIISNKKKKVCKFNNHQK